MKLVITGGRDFDDVDRLTDTLDLLSWHRRLDLLIEGDAKGADRMSGKWADANGIKHVKFPADWNRLGRRAGPMRNQQMIDQGHPNCCLAFPGGTGTADMVRRCVEAHIHVIDCTRYTKTPDDIATYQEFQREMFQIWDGYAISQA